MNFTDPSGLDEGCPGCGSVQSAAGFGLVGEFGGKKAAGAAIRLNIELRKAEPDPVVVAELLERGGGIGAHSNLAEAYDEAVKAAARQADWEEKNPIYGTRGKIRGNDVVSIGYRLTGGQGRREGIIYITGHNVFGIGPIHTAFEFTPVGEPTQWISAVNNNGFLTGGLGNQTDDPSNNKTLGILIPKIPFTNKGLWDIIKKMVLNFNNRRYSYPTDASLFSTRINSNSFTRGVEICTGSTSTYNLSETVGGDTPIPCSSF